MHETAPKETRFLGLDDADADVARAGCIVVPAPFERTSSYTWGSVDGPAAIIRASHEVEFYDCTLGCEPYRLCNGIATAAPLEFGPDEECTPRIQDAVAHWLRQGKFVVTIGGEHTCALGAMLAHVEAFDNLTIVQLDAHSDLRDEYEGTPHSHACVMRRLHERHKAFVAVGIRSQCAEERAFQEAESIPAFYAHDIHRNEAWIDDVIAQTSQNVYVTFDCDVFDPSVVPSTGTPEPGGLTWAQVNAFFERLTKARRLVGFDVTELAPAPGLHYSEFTIAKLIYRLIGLKYMSEPR